MNRRAAFLSWLSMVAAAPKGFAQATGRLRKIGYLGLASAETDTAWLAAFRAGMSELQWVEGRDYVIETRYANGVSEVGPTLAAELVAAKPDLLLTPGDRPARLLAERTQTIPIVLTLSSDPVQNGLAQSLRRPGGNVTGLTALNSELATKRFQLLREVNPRVERIAVFFQPDDVGGKAQLKEIEQAALAAGIKVRAIGLSRPSEIEPAFARATAFGAQAGLVTNGGTITSLRQAMVDSIAKLRIPAIYGRSDFVQMGGLMSYATISEDNYRRAAVYADQILKGAKPADMPIQQPVKFHFAVNLKAAKNIGIAMPQSLLLRADEVIQ